MGGESGTVSGDRGCRLGAARAARRDEVLWGYGTSARRGGSVMVSNGRGCRLGAAHAVIHLRY